jgi:stage II sporulation protein AA (anti-sigma F factor antagonist)
MKMAGDGLRIDVTHVDGQSTLAVDGEIDSDTAASLRSAIEDGLRRTGRVVLDFGGVRFMDSSGLNVLVASAARPDRSRGTVMIRNASAGVRRLLTLTGLDEVVCLEGDAVDVSQSN